MRWTEAVRTGTGIVRARCSGAALPLHVTAYVTTRCNLRCVYCSYPYQQNRELTAAEWESVLEQLAGLGTRRVSFFGGEPLLRRDLEQIVAHAKNLGLRCALTSNGTLVPDRRSLIERLDTLTISLDGDRIAHDANRGAGSHSEAIRALQLARGWGVPTKINTVLSAQNAGALEWLVPFAQQHRVPVSINIMRSEPNGLYHEAASHRLENEQVRKLIDRIIQARSRSRWILFSRATYEVLRAWPDFTVDRLAVGEAEGFRTPPCSAGRFHCAIYADGRLFPCTLTVQQMPALNVRDGVARALDAVRDHGCATCASACMLETNGMFALNPAVLTSLGKRYLTSPFN